MNERLKVLLGETPPGAVKENALPVKSTVIDADGDTWYRSDDGWYECGPVADGGSVYFLPTLSADYGPYEVTYLPADG